MFSLGKAVARSLAVIAQRDSGRETSRDSRRTGRRPGGPTLAAGALMGALALGGCFFTSGINSEPQANIQKDTQGPHHVGLPIAFSAAKSADPDGDSLRVSWEARACNAEGTDCDGAPFDERADLDRFTPFVVTVPYARTDDAEPVGTIAVVLEVVDVHGARHTDQLFVEIANRDPTVSLQPQGYDSPTGDGFPIGTSIDVFATAGDEDIDPSGGDPDAGLVYAWTLFAPRGSIPEDVTWTELAADHYRLTPDIPGLWEVEVTVTDPAGGRATERRPFLVAEDTLPCIASTDPVARETGRYIVDGVAPRRFAVLSVTDDLDFYPARADQTGFLGTASMRWYIATPDTGGAFVEVQGHAVADYVVDPSAYAPGDALSLRVEIDDRVGRQIVCDPAQPTCSLEQNECLQRVTWGVEIR